MCPARPKATPSFRWTDEEHGLLVKLTNEQLALERQDRTNTVSWKKHWHNVSSQLRNSGYNRTPTACDGYFKRTLGAQKANEEAAGPPWNNYESQILVAMTKVQLELEHLNPSEVIPWAQHWTKVSDRLKEGGYTRSVDACEAYWNLVEDDSPLAAGGGVDAKTDSSDDEYDASFIPGVERGGPKEVSESHSKTGTESASAQPESSVLPPAWFSVNAQEKIAVISESTPVEIAKSPNFQKDDSQHRLTLPHEALNVSPEEPSPKPKSRQFRFTSDQRAVLEKEVARNGASPDPGRRKEIACDLGVEERTVRVRGTKPTCILEADRYQNWFVQYRHKAQNDRLSQDNRPQVEILHVNENPPRLPVKRSLGSLDDMDAIEVIPPGMADPPREDHRSKKPRLPSGLSPEAMTKSQARIDSSQIATSQPINSNPIIGHLKHQEPLPGVSSITLDGLLESQGWTVSARTGEGQSIKSTFDSMVQMEKRSSSSSQSSLEDGRNMSRVDSNYCREPDSSQLNSAPRPSTNIESRRTSSKTPHEYEPATPVSSNAKSTEGSRSSQSTNRNEFPRLNSLNTPQPVTNAPTHEGDKAYASRRVTEIQAEIQTLKHDSDTRVIIFHQIEQEISDVKNQDTELQEHKAEEIQRVLREIEERYKREHEALEEKRKSLQEAKVREMEGLEKNAEQVAKKEKRMEPLQALLDLDDD